MKWNGVMCGRGEMWEITLEDGLEVLVGGQMSFANERKVDDVSG